MPRARCICPCPHAQVIPLLESSGVKVVVLGLGSVSNAQVRHATLHRGLLSGGHKLLQGQSQANPIWLSHIFMATTLRAGVNCLSSCHTAAQRVCHFMCQLPLCLLTSLSPHPTNLLLSAAAGVCPCAQVPAGPPVRPPGGRPAVPEPGLQPGLCEGGSIWYLVRVIMAGVLRLLWQRRALQAESYSHACRYHVHVAVPSCLGLAARTAYLLTLIILLSCVCVTLIMILRTWTSRPTSSCCPCWRASGRRAPCRRWGRAEHGAQIAVQLLLLSLRCQRAL